MAADVAADQRARCLPRVRLAWFASPAGWVVAVAVWRRPPRWGVEDWQRYLCKAINVHY